MLTPDYTGTSRSSYQGTLSIGGVVVWSCPHAHDLHGGDVPGALSLDNGEYPATWCAEQVRWLVMGQIHEGDLRGCTGGFGEGDGEIARRHRLEWWHLRTVEASIPRLRALVQHFQAGGTLESFEAAEREQAEAAKVA